MKKMYQKKNVLEENVLENVLEENVLEENVLTDTEKCVLELNSAQMSSVVVIKNSEIGDNQLIKLHQA